MSELNVLYKFTALFNIQVNSPATIQITFPSAPSTYAVTAGSSCSMTGTSNIVKATTCTITSLTYAITLSAG